MTTSTVYIIDDDSMARESLKWLIESAVLPVQVYASGLEFLDQVETSMSGCVLLDVRMPEINGMELFTRLKQREILLPVIIVTGHADVAMAVRAMKAGAYDFIEKPYNDALMLERVQHAITYDQDKRRNQQRVAAIKACADQLTPREQEVMRYVLNSTQSKVIAAELGISIKTVELHRANLMTKMQARTPAELVRQVLIADLE
ncbi:Two-component transcriptional response regulator, LuxR family [hydrothermal vent metagenome]|uniref:Two-component transcriptional response regulator, LuxR family n=1 Tax=hydrothermal vent metagenome TaxID=652676 RepID=A0A3B1B8W7_9ZZZZ